MEKKSVICAIFAIVLIVSSISFAFAESATAYSQVDFATVAESESAKCTFDGNSAIIIATATLLIIGAVLLVKRKKQIKKRKKKA